MRSVFNSTGGTAEVDGCVDMMAAVPFFGTQCALHHAAGIDSDLDVRGAAGTKIQRNLSDHITWIVQVM